jgi:hypothetical protein
MRGGNRLFWIVHWAESSIPNWLGVPENFFVLAARVKLRPADGIHTPWVSRRAPPA